VKLFFIYLFIFFSIKKGNFGLRSLFSQSYSPLFQKKKKKKKKLPINRVWGGMPCNLCNLFPGSLYPSKEAIKRSLFESFLFHLQCNPYRTSSIETSTKKSSPILSLEEIVLIANQVLTRERKKKLEKRTGKISPPYENLTLSLFAVFSSPYLSLLSYLYRFL